MTAVGALFDSSRQLINGPTNAISIALFSALAAVPADQKVAYAVLLALLVGVTQMGITLLRLGDLFTCVIFNFLNRGQGLFTYTSNSCISLQQDGCNTPLCLLLLKLQLRKQRAEK